MNASQIIVLLGVILASVFSTAVSLHCYRCHSSDAGCGQNVNIRLQRWHNCEEPGKGGGENFCVKVIETRGSEQYITRDCLMTLRRHAEHRMKMPTVQRHGYCNFARGFNELLKASKFSRYCFCNDWNGCNPASTIRGAATVATVVALVVAMVNRYL